MLITSKKIEVHYLRKNKQNKGKFFYGDEKNLITWSKNMIFSVIFALLLQQQQQQQTQNLMSFSSDKLGQSLDFTWL